MCVGVYCWFVKRKVVFCFGCFGFFFIGVGDFDRFIYGVVWVFVICFVWFEVGFFDGEVGYDVVFVEDGDIVGVLVGVVLGSCGVDDYLGVLSGGLGGSWDRSRLVG